MDKSDKSWLLLLAQAFEKDAKPLLDYPEGKQTVEFSATLSMDIASRLRKIVGE